MSVFENNNVDNCITSNPEGSNYRFVDNSLQYRSSSEQPSTYSKDGYLPVGKPSNKQNKYGGSAIIFWTLVVILFLLAVCNLTLTFIILGVLRLGQGLESLELVSEENLIKFYGSADLDQIFKRDGVIESYMDIPLEIDGDDTLVGVNIVEGERVLNPKLDVDVNNINIKNVELFEIIDPVTGQPLFSTDFPNFGLPRGVIKLDVNMAYTKRIASPIDQKLSIVSDSIVKLKGSEGTHMNGREIIWSADQDIFLISVNGSIVINSNDSVFIDVKSLPIAMNEIYHERTHDQYKLCVCMPKGKLFRVPVPAGRTMHVNCNMIDYTYNNPCI